jgi:hypothetical protein
LAAESHVDRSITDPNAFINTNVFGTANLLNFCKEFWTLNPDHQHGNFPEGKRETFSTTFLQTKFTELLAKQDSLPKKLLTTQNLLILPAKLLQTI